MARRYVLLTQGSSHPIPAKTAVAMLRYRAPDVVALLDADHAGQTAASLLGLGGELPVVGKLDEVEADGLVIGTAPPGGRLPPDMRAIVRDAVTRGMEVVSGLHEFLADDPELRELAGRSGARLRDLRRPPAELALSRNEARDTPCLRVHTVGHDGAVGKMTVAVEIWRALRARGRDARFVATGQTGILVSGAGVAVDAVPADFISGAVEAEVLARRDAEIVIVEGQGSLLHPQFSGVTLGLLHGCAPDAMILCLDAVRRHIRHCEEVPIPSAERVVDLYERMAALVHPGRVAGVAVNTAELDEPSARAAVREAEALTGLPASDVLRFGVGPLVDAVERTRERS
jgi:uncharacterized NAD-dependent epimerase/dehydratase family protein